MFPNQDQISAAAKANLESGFAFYASLTGQALQSVEKLISLNLNAAKASMEESSAATRQLLSAKDPQEFMTLVSAQMKPNLDKAISYGSHLAGIATSSQAEFSKTAEEQLAAAGSKVHELIDSASKNAPAGTENFVAMMKTAVGNASNGYEQLTRAGKQATEVFQSNLNAAAGQFTQAASKKATANS